MNFAKLTKVLATYIPSVCSLMLAGQFASAGELTVNLTDQNGEAVDEAVVILMPLQGSDDSHAAATDPQTDHMTDQHAVMAQRDLSFIPHVLPVMAGTEVSFPNQDQTRHHVYSFSDAKTFELKLYDGEEERSVMFDQPGIVVLGCNIHDNMLGYIYVSESDLFSATNTDGQAVFEGLEAGSYSVQIWHPRLRGKPEDYTLSAEVTENDATRLETQLKLRRKRRASSPY